MLLRKNLRFRILSKPMMRMSYLCRKSNELLISFHHTLMLQIRIKHTIILLKKQGMQEQEYGFISVYWIFLIFHFSRVFHETQLPMKGEWLTQFLQINLLEIFLIYLEFISQMDENLRMHGLENLFFIENFQRIHILFVRNDIVCSGVEISIALIKRSIWLVQKPMMGKLGFIRWSELGSILVNLRVGMISGEKKIQIC